MLMTAGELRELTGMPGASGTDLVGAVTVGDHHAHRLRAWADLADAEESVSVAARVVR